MGSLSNLYISQSYQGLIHLATNTSASANLIQLQDGLGNNLGVSLNTEGDISASGDLTANTLRIELDTEITGGVDINTFFTASTPGYTNSTNPYFTDVVRVIGSYGGGGIPPTINDVKVGWICNGINVTNGIVTAVSGSGTGDVYVTIAGSLPQISQPYTFTGMVTIPTRITGSLQVSNDITASSMQLRGDLFVSGTIHAYEVITTVESASVIFSSGSNVIGDSTSDTQTIVGQTTISGSLTIDGQLIHRGNVDITGSLKVSNDISSSTVSGIGNVTAYSASVDSRLDYLEGPFSTSVDNRLDLIEFFTSSEETKNITLAAYTGSNDTKWNTLTNVTASLLSFTSSQETKNITLASYTGSNDTKWSTLTNVTSSLLLFTSSQETKDITLGNYTSSLITAFTASGANVTFNGNINVLNAISSSTINGIGNVTTYSASVDLRLDQLEAFSSSVNLDFVTQTELAAATGSLINSIATKLDTGSFNAYTASVSASLSAYSSSVSASFASVSSSLSVYSSSVSESFASVNIAINQRLLTSSFNSYTQSQDTKNSTVASYTGSNDIKWNTLGGVTGSYATTGSNTFIGTNTFSGSVQGVVTSISVLSSTASIDCSLGNFFNLGLPTGSTYLTATNIKSGLTITVKVDTNSNRTVVIDSSKLKFQNGTPYINTGTAATDILTFVSFDSGSLYGVAANLFS